MHKHFRSFCNFFSLLNIILLYCINNYNVYNALVRVYNIDDEAWFAKNFDWGNRLNYMGALDPNYTGWGDREKDRYRRDAIWGVNNLNNGDKITFTTYNEFYSGYAYGYQVWYGNTGSNPYWKYCEALAGVAGVLGAEQNATYNGNSYYGGRHCDYNPQ